MMTQLLPADPARRRHGRRMLLLLCTVFTLPVALVLAMYWLDWHPQGSSHGNLVRPPQALRFTELRDSRGHGYGARHWQDKWHLVQVAAGACARDCLREAQLLRNIHVSLNKESGRVERVLLLPQPVSEGALATLQRRFPDLVILSGAGAMELAAQLAEPGQAAAGVYLVDPLGNLMMRYALGYQARGMRDDLGRLLRYSWVG